MITIKKIQQLNDVKYFNISEIARRASIKNGTLNAKISKGTELTIKESLDIEKVLTDIEWHLTSVLNAKN